MHASRRVTDENWTMARNRQPKGGGKFGEWRGKSQVGLPPPQPTHKLAPRYSTRYLSLYVYVFDACCSLTCGMAGVNTRLTGRRQTNKETRSRRPCTRLVVTEALMTEVRVKTLNKPYRSELVWNERPNHMLQQEAAETTVWVDTTAE